MDEVVQMRQVRYWWKNWIFQPLPT